MYIIHLPGCSLVVSYWDYITECGELECNASYWMVPGTVAA